MNTPDLTIRPCEAQPAPRRADCVLGCLMSDVESRLSDPSAPSPRTRRTRSRFASPHIRHPTSHIRHLPAFTLVELTVVLSLIAIVSAVAIPRYWSSIARYRVDLAARRVAADLSLAQTRARTTGQFRNVVFAASNAAYALPEETSFNTNTGSQTVDLSADPYYVSFNAFTTTDGGRRITFDGFGQPAQGLNLSLLCVGHQRTVRVDQSTGSIYVTNP